MAGCCAGFGRFIDRSSQFVGRLSIYIGCLVLLLQALQTIFPDKLDGARKNGQPGEPSKGDHSFGHYVSAFGRLFISLLGFHGTWTQDSKLLKLVSSPAPLEPGPAKSPKRLGPIARGPTFNGALMCQSRAPTTNPARL